MEQGKKRPEPHKEAQEEDVKDTARRDEPARQKKLLVVTDCFLPRWDGISRFLIELLPFLQQSFDVTIVAPDFGRLDRKLEAKMVRLPVFRHDFGDINFTLPHPRMLRSLCKEADLVFTQSIGPLGISGIWAAKKEGKPVISFTHSVDWELATRSVRRFKKLTNLIARAVARYAYRKSSLLIVPSEEVEHLLRKNRIKTPVKVIHLGVDTEKFIPAEDRKAVRESLDLDPYVKIIGYAGRIGREKDLITLYRAFRKVEKRHTDVKLMLVGKGVREQERLFSSHRSIIMPGSVDNVVDYLQAMDIFVLPSLTETSSLATMEAMSCGLPVISTPVGYVKEYIREKRNGMLFPFKNSLVLSLKLEMLLENPELRAELGSNARDAILKRFRWKDTAERILKVLSQY